MALFLLLAILGGSSLGRADLSSAEAPQAPRCLTPVPEFPRGLSDSEIRARYQETVCQIGADERRWVDEGDSLADRAYCAWKIRHDARVGARASMSIPETWILELRDLFVYGNSSGPTFESLLAKHESDGLCPEQAYEAIIRSASDTNPEVDSLLDVQASCP